jgi:pantoate kinase
MKQPTLENFLKLSRSFAENTGLITEKVRKVLDETIASGIICSMPIFGEGVFSIVKQNMVDPLLEVFRKNVFTGKTFVSEIDFKGARLL